MLTFQIIDRGIGAGIYARTIWNRRGNHEVRGNYESDWHSARQKAELHVCVAW